MAGSQPLLPGLLALSATCLWLSPEGEIARLDHGEARSRAARQPPLVCHARLTAQRLGAERLDAFDLLELFAFAHPARFAVPTPRGLAEALGLTPPKSPEGGLALFPRIAGALLATLAAPQAERTHRIARRMQEAGWIWGDAVVAALGPGPGAGAGSGAYEVWNDLPDWDEPPPRQPGDQFPVSGEEARQRLAELVARLRLETGETRTAQGAYSAHLAQSFEPPEAPGSPHLVLAEAGTGIGKTLGYLAPASLWAERNGAPVWLSTYTRNLQRQIEATLDRLDLPLRIVTRKGRENYLCLLNYEDAVRGALTRARAAVPLGLIARWLQVTRAGDLGGDLPGWLIELLGRGPTTGLSDRRGECIHAACPHYRKCFVERSVRAARHADLVIANHALVMIQAATLNGPDPAWPTRLVFDEGHHLFEAADSAFSSHLSALETAELRRWLRGGETGSRSRMRGLRRRLENLPGDKLDDPEQMSAEALVEDIHGAASALAGPGWTSRIGDGDPQGATERFLAEIRRVVYARSDHHGAHYDLETATLPPDPAVLAAAMALDAALDAIIRPMVRLRRMLAARLDAGADTLGSDDRRRIDALGQGLMRRIEMLRGWRAMLAALEAGPDDAFADWFAVSRIEGRDIDVGLHRHWIDPTLPLAECLRERVHGVAVTSASLRDDSGDAEADWLAAERRVGALHFPTAPLRADFASPFDYPGQALILVVDDIPKNDPDQVAAAYRALFRAAGGGALGLFTSIQRLRQTHARLVDPLAGAGLQLYAQHVDPISPATLIDIFRAEPRACLLGTDALRDGVDVPGEALRLIVMDRVPWPRPSLLHKARRAQLGGRQHDEMLTRFRLKQAFGRLIRTRQDRGVFVLLDRQLPTRLTRSFPAGMAIHRIGLADAVTRVEDFLMPGSPPSDDA